MGPAHLFACSFQVRRAFHSTFHSIVGGSIPVARMRAQVWQSIFTHDLRRYQRGLYQRLGDVTALVTGPSGTGKELVARAIALSRYIPFDPETRSFGERPEESYAETGSYQEAARRLGLDRRTVKARVDEELLVRLRPDWTGREKNR